MNNQVQSTSDVLDQTFTNELQLRYRRNTISLSNILNQNLFDKSQEVGERGIPLTPSQKLKRWTSLTMSKMIEWQPDVPALVFNFFRRVFPIIRWLPKYKLKSYLLGDLIAGFTVGIMNIPQGMAYAMLAQVPKVFGLYSSFYPAIIYTLTCTSQHVSFGTFAITSLMTGKVISSYVTQTTGNSTTNASFVDNSNFEDDLQLRVDIMVTVTVAVGIWQILLGILGLGYLSVCLSDQLVKGFTTGAAFHVFTSQLKSIFGLKNLKEYAGPLKLAYMYMDLINTIHLTNIPSLVVSIVCIIFLILTKWLFNSNSFVQSKLPFKFAIPGDLLVVTFGALTSYLMDLPGPHYNVSVVGKIPLGLPPPVIPNWSLLPKLALDSFTIAFVSFALVMSLAKLYAEKYGYVVDANQEFRAIGISNLFSGFFQCMPSTAALGRTSIQESAGGSTQLVSIVSSLTVLIVILALGFLLKPLPQACLGSILLVSLIGLLGQVTEVRQLWKLSALDTSVFVVSLVGVLLLDVDSGLALAIGWSLLTVLLRTQRPDVAILGRAIHTDSYQRVDVYKSTIQMRGCRIIRFESPLYFMNADYFSRRMRQLSGMRKVKQFNKDLTVARQGITHAHSNTLSVVDCNPGLNNAVSSSAHLTETQFVTASTDKEKTNTIPSEENDPSSSITYVILDCSGMSFTDVNGIKAIKGFARECRGIGISLLLACCNASVREMLTLSGYTPDLPKDNIFITIQEAVTHINRRLT